MNEIMKFEDTEVEIIEINEEPHFEVYSTGKALGYARWNGGRTSCTPQRDRIEKAIKNAGIEPVLRDAKLYISEAQLYDLMLEVRTEKCRPFRKWVTGTVLPSIRRTGTYSLPGAQQPAGYPHKASSLGEAATIIKVLDRIMTREKQPPEAIARMAEGICQYCGIPLPQDFVKRDPFVQLTLIGFVSQ